jgi:hypothetical protein
MITFEFDLGPDAYVKGHFVYVWLNGDLDPIYVGETGQSPADRCGLHIRDQLRSGAIVGKHIAANPRQRYQVLAFPANIELLEAIAKENGSSSNAAALKRSRQALERVVYDALQFKYASLKKAKGCTWTAHAGAAFAASVCSEISDANV